LLAILAVAETVVGDRHLEPVGQQAGRQVEQ